MIKKLLFRLKKQLNHHSPFGERPNCIVKAFQNNNISIIKDDDNKYHFRGSDVAKALEITNIRSSIQNFTSKEKGVRRWTPLEVHKNHNGGDSSDYLIKDGLFN